MRLIFPFAMMLGHRRRKQYLQEDDRRVTRCSGDFELAVNPVYCCSYD